MKIWKYGDDIDTDLLFAGKYTYSCATADEIRPHLLEDLDPSFATGVTEGDIIMAGKNFGCGSSREQPVVGLRALGLQAVVAKGFARIFYRAAINQGLLLVECAAAVDAYREGDEVSIALEAATITVADRSFTFAQLPEEIRLIREAGGLLPYTIAALKRERK